MGGLGPEINTFSDVLMRIEHLERVGVQTSQRLRLLEDKVWVSGLEESDDNKPQITDAEVTRAAAVFQNAGLQNAGLGGFPLRTVLQDFLDRRCSKNA